MKRTIPVIAAAALIVASQCTAYAQQFPTKTVRIIVPFLGGAAPDLIARLVAEGLTKTFGKPVIVENKTGANGNIAAEDILHSPADGHSILFGVDASIVVNPHLYKLNFDPLKDLTPVASLASNQLLLGVNNDLPARNLKEFVELAKTSNPPLTYSSSGIGSQHHLAMELLMRRAGIPKMVHVPFKGAVAGVSAVIAGETKAGFSGSASTPQVKAGRMRGIAVSGTKRSDTFPDLPTIAETYPGYSVEVWFGLLVRAGTPDAVVEQLNKSVRDLLSQPDFVARMRSSGSVDVLNISRQDFGELIKTDYEKYGRIVSELGIKQADQQP